MAKYINITTQEVSTDSQIKKLHSNVSFSKVVDTFADLGYAPVLAAPKPAPSSDIRFVRGTAPVQDANGNWVEGYEEVDMFSGEDKAAQEAKFLRDKADKTIEALQDAVQSRLDDFAKTRYYNDITSACTYATSQNPVFAAEGQYCVNARDTTWAYLYGELAKIKAGTRTLPASYGELEPELPVLEWPV